MRPMYVAAAVVAAVAKNADIELILDKILITPITTHDTNPVMGPLFVGYLSDDFVI